MTAKLQQLLKQGLQQLNLIISSTQQNQLLRYLELLLKWNNTYNLVASHDPQEILINHFLDSLSIAMFVEGKTILDLGSGAGFPGLPLAIIFPEKNFTLLDSNGKKIHFLTQVKIELALENVTIVQGRVENFKSVGCFDSIVTRAVTSLKKIIMQSHHLLCPSGKILVMKGLPPRDELQELACAYKIFPLTVPFLPKERHLVVISLFYGNFK